jgi:nitrous oxidase accessory protein NosD
MMLKNVTIENLAMHCPADCIISWGGPHRNITIRETSLIATGFGIQVAETDSWRILGNTIQAGGVAVDMIEASRITLLNNRLAGFIPVKLYHSHDCRVIHNTALGKWEGVLVTSLSNGNLVIANTILSVESAGISLEPETHDNQVHGNRVQCAAGYDCLTVQALDIVWDQNHISGNRP